MGSSVQLIGQREAWFLPSLLLLSSISSMMPKSLRKEVMIKVEFTSEELTVLSYVVEFAKDEFINHGCNEVDVTKLGLDSSNADNIRTLMAEDGVIDNKEVEYCSGSKYLQDADLLKLLHKKLKNQIK